MTLAGFKPVRIEHLQLKASEVTHADVTVRIDAGTITVGTLVADPMVNDPLTTRFSQDFINKLPF